jgi:hypothetical protein
MRPAEDFGEFRMNDSDAARVRATAQDLLDAFGAYENELRDLERETPDLGRLRRAVGVALAEASFWGLDRNAAQGGEAAGTAH